MPIWSRRRLLALLTLPLAGTAACDEQSPVVCTAVFVASTVTLLDHSGAPVSDAIVTSILTRTGETLAPISSSGTAAGAYIVVDDHSRGELRQRGDTVAVHASRDAHTITSAEYVFDVPGGCHIHKLSGPDTLTLR
jgi:hypothetical protein